MENCVYFFDRHCEIRGKYCVGHQCRYYEEKIEDSGIPASEYFGYNGGFPEDYYCQEKEFNKNKNEIVRKF